MSIEKIPAMKEYKKIQSVFMRDPKTKKFIIGNYSLPVFKELQMLMWIWTEKINGTNCRVYYNKETQKVRIGGKTDDANLPIKAYEFLEEMFTVERFGSLPSTTLYGELYGKQISRDSKQYNPTGLGFSLFDVVIDGWRLERHNIEDIAKQLSIDVVKLITECTLADAVRLIYDIDNPIMSVINPDVRIEGIVGRPRVNLFDHKGEFVITKVKYNDFVR